MLGLGYTDPKLVWEKINQFGNTHILKTNALASKKLPKHFVLNIEIKKGKSHTNLFSSGVGLSFIILPD
jgi:hypothetical protein